MAESKGKPNEPVRGLPLCRNASEGPGVKQGQKKLALFLIQTPVGWKRIALVLTVMAKFKFEVVCIICCFTVVYALSITEKPCKVSVAEGSNLAFNFDGDPSYTINHDLTWLVTIDGSSKPVSVCNITMQAKPCNDLYPSFFSASLSGSSGKSSLTIASVNRSMTKVNVRQQHFPYTTTGNCDMEVYAFPVSVTCDEPMLKDEFLAVECTAEGLFPDGKCSFRYQADNGLKYTVGYENEFSTVTKLYTSKCTLYAEMHSLLPQSSYSFQVDVIPNVTSSHQNMTAVRSNWTTPIIFEPPALKEFSATVVRRESKTVIANRGDRVKFICTSTGNPPARLQLCTNNSSFPVYTSHHPNILEYSKFNLQCNDTNIFLCQIHKNLRKSIEVFVRCPLEFQEPANPIKTYNVNVGSDTHITFTLVGYPPPQNFSLYQGDQGETLLHEGQKYNVELVEISPLSRQPSIIYNVTLTIYNIDAGDFTRYIFQAGNEVGSGSHAFTLFGNDDPEESSNWPLYLGISLGCSVFLALVIILSICLWRRKIKKSKKTTSPESDTSTSHKVVSFAIKNRADLGESDNDESTMEGYAHQYRNHGHQASTGPYFDTRPTYSSAHHLDHKQAYAFPASSNAEYTSAIPSQQQWSNNETRDHSSYSPNFHSSQMTKNDLEYPI